MSATESADRLVGGPIHRNRSLVSVLVGIVGFFMVWAFTMQVGSGGDMVNTFVDIKSAAIVFLSPVALLILVYGWAGFVEACSYVFRRRRPGKAAEDVITFFRLWAAFALGSGFLATMVGLMIMLNNLNDPTMIGPGMAVALLSQMYGVFIAVICVACAAIVARRHNGPASAAPLGRQSAGVAGITVVAGTMTVLIAFGILVLSLQISG